MPILVIRSLLPRASACCLLLACSAEEQPTATDSADSANPPAQATPAAGYGGPPPALGEPDGVVTPGEAPAAGLAPGETPLAEAPGVAAPGSGAPAPLDPDDGALAPEPEPGGLIRGDAPSVEAASNPGPFDVDTVTTGLRDGPDYGTQTLFVPLDAEPPFASVVVVPGFVSPESSIRAWGPFLASHGIVTLTIGTNSGGDPPEARAQALLDGIETLRAEHTRSGGPLEGQLALDRFGVMGWSMGGGGTLIAANANPELRAAVSFAAWSPGARFSQDQVPTLLLAGSADALAGGQSQGFFESIPESTPKLLFEVSGGAHSVANDPRSADGAIGRFGLSWLKVFLEGDARYRPLLLEEPSQASDFRGNL